jgi:replicative DNA helicase
MGDKQQVEILSNLEMLRQIGKAPETFIKSGFETLDTYTKGFRLGELISVTGQTKHGKTEWCRTLTKNFVNQGEYPLWLSFEEIPREFLHKFENAGRGLHFFMPNKLEMYDPQWCIDVINQAHEQHGVSIAFIDNLHYIINIAEFRNPSLIIGSTIRKLKRLAIDKGLLIFLICHIQKAKLESEHDMDFTLMRDSSFLSQESDAVIFLYRKVKSDGLTHMDESFLKLCFHRYTGCMDRLIPLVKNGAYFKEISFE